MAEYGLLRWCTYPQEGHFRPAGCQRRLGRGAEQREDFSISMEATRRLTGREIRRRRCVVWRWQYGRLAPQEVQSSRCDATRTLCRTSVIKWQCPLRQSVRATRVFMMDASVGISRFGSPRAYKIGCIQCYARVLILHLAYTNSGSRSTPRSHSIVSKTIRTRLKFS